MSVKVQVTDSNNRAVAKAEVFVKWKSGGFSKEHTSNSGVADLKCSGGTIEYIEVWGEKVLGTLTVGNDEMVEVTSDKR
jgi:hypothetical protein